MKILFILPFLLIGCGNEERVKYKYEFNISSPRGVFKVQKCWADEWSHSMQYRIDDDTRISWYCSDCMCVRKRIKLK